MFRGNSIATKSVDYFMKVDQQLQPPVTLRHLNQLLSFCVFLFQVVGVPYLIETLGETLDMIYHENRMVELDPYRIQLMQRYVGFCLSSVLSAFQECSRRTRRPSLRVIQSEDDVVRSSAETLLRYLNAIVCRVFNSLDRMPPVMRLVFAKLRERVAEKWPEERMRVSKCGAITTIFLH